MVKNILCTSFFLVLLVLSGCTETPVNTVEEPAAHPVTTEFTEQDAERMKQSIQGLIDQIDPQKARTELSTFMPSPESLKQDGQQRLHSATQPVHIWTVDLEGDNNIFSHPAFKRGVSYDPAGTLVYLLATPTLADASVTGQDIDNVNVWDFYIVVGDFPAVTPKTGSLWFATNTAFYDILGGTVNGVNALDMVDMTYSPSGNIFTMSVDKSLSALSLWNNMFNISSSFIANAYLVHMGNIVFDFSSDFMNFDGTISLQGTGSVFFGNVPYDARINGDYLGTIEYEF